MEDSQGTIALVIPIVAIAGWLLYAIVSVVVRARISELEVRARIAMIEKGMVPPPERDPGEFDKAMNATQPAEGSTYRHYRAYKLRSAGITMMAVGLGLWVMMYPNFRVGGFLVVVGLGFIVTALFERQGSKSEF